MGVVITHCPLMLLPLKRGFWELGKDLKNKERVTMACEPKQLINDAESLTIMWQLAADTCQKGNYKPFQM